MSTKRPESTIPETNLSRAWARVFLMTMDRSDRELTPLVISIDGFTDNLPFEDIRVRQALDLCLAGCGRFSCDVSALTIFPFKHWNRVGRPHIHDVSEWYLRQFLPRLKARDPRNRNGTYFERMIAFRGARTRNGKPVFETKNQLEQIIRDWNRDREHPKRPRQSALQVACFDPAKDHTGQAVRGFPCLQQVSFTYDSTGGLAISAYYPTQFIFDRAYGNYLGLCQLGCFMAQELGLQLVRLNCFIARPELGSVTKTKLRGLEKIVREIIFDVDKQQQAVRLVKQIETAGG